MKRYIVGLGEALWDMLPEGKKIGGAPANFAYHAGQWGMASMVISAVGRDALGEETMDTFEKIGLSCLMEYVNKPTGTVGVTLDDKGVPKYEIYHDVAWDNMSYTPVMDEIARSCRAVCFGTLAQRSPLSHETISHFLRVVPDDALRIFDINLRQDFYSVELIKESLGRCDILKINDEETKLVASMFGYDETDMEAISRKILSDFRLKMLVLTCGTDGSYVFSQDGETSFLPTPKVKVADTVGAGDSFTGTFCASLLKGMSIPEAHALAVKVSAFVCTQEGAMPKYDQSFI